MRTFSLDNGGQGCSKTVMANQSHDRGEPSKLDNGYPASRVPVGEPKNMSFSACCGSIPLFTIEPPFAAADARSK